MADRPKEEQVISDRFSRLAGLYAVAAALGWLVLSPLLALAYLATADGAAGLESRTVAAWAEPARDLAGGLLTFASEDRVYATYLQALALLLPALFVAASATRARRRGREGGFERWAWRVALFGYALGALGLLAAAVAEIPGSGGGALEVVYLAVMVPGMMVSVLGSTLLGIALLRGGHRPRATAWLLAFAIVWAVVGSAVLGHNSLGFAPLFVAWAATGRRLRRSDVPSAARAEPATG